MYRLIPKLNSSETPRVPKCTTFFEDFVYDYNVDAQIQKHGHQTLSFLDPLTGGIFPGKKKSLKRITSPDYFWPYCLREFS